ncbi:MAG: HAD family hydrolase [Pseudomonadota bacterium]
MNKLGTKVDALLFDKDGTLFDFHKSWGLWAAHLIEDLSQGNAARKARLAAAMHYDLEARIFMPSSPIIACTNREAAECVALGLGETDIDRIEALLMHSAAKAQQAPVLPLVPFFEELMARGLRIGLMTNDTELAARAHLKQAGISRFFDMVIGFDTGFGAKPAPDPLLAFAREIGQEPNRIAMVGDSAHDLIAGRAAGMQTIAVLTGVAEATKLSPYADVVLPDIGHLPDWLSA